MRAAEFIAMLVLGGAVATAGSVEPGASREEVLKELGAPTGFIRISNFGEILYFADLTVKIVSNRVAEVRARSDEPLLRVAQPARTPPRAAQPADPETVQAELQRMVQSPGFRILSPEEQIARLFEFAATHPGAQISPYVALARREMELREARAEAARRTQELLDELQRAQAQRTREILPSYMVYGDRMVWYVRPWTLGFHDRAGPAFLDRRPDCRYRPATVAPGYSNPAWPYDFGLSSEPLRIGPRQPGMRW